MRAASREDGGEGITVRIAAQIAAQIATRIAPRIAVRNGEGKCRACGSDVDSEWGQEETQTAPVFAGEFGGLEALFCF